MNSNCADFLPGEISMAGLKGMTRLEQLAPLVTLENVHDGSPTSLEYSRLAVDIFDEYLESIDFLLASPLLPTMPKGDKERLEAHRVEMWGRRAKAQRAVELNFEKSLEARTKE